MPWRDKLHWWLVGTTGLFMTAFIAFVSWWITIEIRTGERMLQLERRVLEVELMHEYGEHGYGMRNEPEEEQGQRPKTEKVENGTRN